MATVDYGLDLACVDDLDADMTEVTGRRVLAEALARRLSTPRGGLIDDPNYGTDVRGYLNDDLSKADIARIGAAVDAECRKDERVLRTTTQVGFVSGALTLSIQVVDLSGPFRLVLGVTDVSVDVLKVGN